MSKILLVSGHGYSDVGAVGNGTNERDFIRKYITPNVAKHIRNFGGTVEIYNPDWNMFMDTNAGYGMYRYKGQDVIVVEFHLDASNSSATGGHVIIHSGLVADNIDNNIVKAINRYVGLRGGRGIDGRNDLLQVNVAQQLGINYRLVELGFITNTRDMNNIKDNIDGYTKELASAILDKSTPVKTNVKTPTPAKKKATPKAKGKSISQLADEVIAGKHGNGNARVKSLGSNYAKVQAEVNKRLAGTPKKAPLKSTNVIVNEVIAGKWGNGQARFNALRKAGYNPDLIQREVNKRF